MLRTLAITVVLCVTLAQNLPAGSPVLEDRTHNPLHYAIDTEKYNPAVAAGTVGDPHYYSGTTAELQEFINETNNLYTGLSGLKCYKDVSATAIIHMGKSPEPIAPQWSLTIDERRAGMLQTNFSSFSWDGNLNIVLDIWVDNDKIKLSELTIPEPFEIELAPEIQTFMTRHKRSWLKRSIETVKNPFKKNDTIRAQND
jgi:hypothetical protein